MRVCEGCGNEFDPGSSSVAYCGATCKKRIQRRGKQPAGEADEVTPAGVAVQVATRLAEVGRQDTYLAAVAMTIARRIESNFETGSAVAALSRELDRVMDKALEGAQVETDELDELRAARDRKRGA